MKNFVLSHHLGLGDHIILNGLVRYIYAREMTKGYDKFYLTCFDRNEKNVRYMYRDLPLLDLIVLEDSPTSGIMEKIHRMAIGGQSEDLHLNQDGLRLYEKIGDDAFFEVFGYDKKLIHAFHIERDFLQDEKTFQTHTERSMGNERFIFMHDDRDRDFRIDLERMYTDQNRGAIAMMPGKETPIFDYLILMEKAEEIHVISSAFLCLCIAIPELAKKTTAHLYVRNPYLKNYCESKGIKVLV